MNSFSKIRPECVLTRKSAQLDNHRGFCLTGLGDRFYER